MDRDKFSYTLDIAFYIFIMTTAFVSVVNSKMRVSEFFIVLIYIKVSEVRRDVKQLKRCKTTEENKGE